MKIEIENYRGYDIRFDTESENFECDIDDSRSVKKSYSSLKKFLDEFIKENKEFKKVKVIPNPTSWHGKHGTVVGIRKDKRFIIELENGKKEQISDYNENDYILYKPEYDVILIEIETLKKQVREINKEIDLKKKSILGITLKDYKSMLDIS